MRNCVVNNGRVQIRGRPLLGVDVGVGEFIDQIQATISHEKDFIDFMFLASLPLTDCWIRCC